MDHGQGHGNGAEGRRTFLVSAAGAGLALAAGRARAAEAGKKGLTFRPPRT